MLIEPLLQLLNKLNLTGMLGALQRQFGDPDAGALRFEERLAMLLQHELGIKPRRLRISRSMVSRSPMRRLHLKIRTP